MLHQNTVFHGLLKHVPWLAFDRLVEQHRADARVRRLTTKSQLIALLYGQLSGASSLREIIAGLGSHRARLYHLGARPAHRSTLADANAQRPPAVFGELFALMVSQANRHVRRALGDTVYLIDSTGLRLDRRSADWARFSDAACGAKVHLIYDPDEDRPIYAVVTAANVNDITPAKAMPIEPAPPTSSTWAITITTGGPGSIERSAASSPGSNPTRLWRWSRNCRYRPRSRGAL
jgi:hypothetical protein